MAYSITLQTSDSGIDPGEKIGIIGFAASNEDSGSDATTIAASIHAEAEGEFTANSNKTSIVFSTASSGTDDNTSQLRISSSGHFLPITDNTKDLGASNLRFRNIFGNYGDFDNLTIAGASGFVVIDDLYSVSGYLQGQIDNIPADTNTFVTGVEYNTSQRNIILSRNDGVSLTGNLDVVLHSGDSISLLTNDIGYISTIPKRYSITSTSNTFSSFTTAANYTPGQIDIFQNGVKLHDGTDFTATNGSGIALTNYAPNGSIIEYIISMSSGVFTPLEISGLQLWLDANDTETITLNSNTVSSWNDKSGNGYHVSQSTATNQPTYTYSALNSKNVVRFDGANDVLTNTTDTPVGGSTNRTVFVVFNHNSGIIKYPFVLGNSTSTGQAFGISQEIAVRVNSGSRKWSTAVDSTHAIVTIVLDGTSTTDLSAWKNGSSLTVSSTAVQTINTAAGFIIGNGPSGGNLQGDVAEIIVYNSALSTSDRQSVESYLSTKWGIS